MEHKVQKVKKAVHDIQVAFPSLFSFAWFPSPEVTDQLPVSRVYFQRENVHTSMIYGMCTVYFTRYCQITFQKGSSNWPSHQQCIRVPNFPRPYQDWTLLFGGFVYLSVLPVWWHFFAPCISIFLTQRELEHHFCIFIGHLEPPFQNCLFVSIYFYQNICLLLSLSVALTML